MSTPRSLKSSAERQAESLHALAIHLLRKLRRLDFDESRPANAPTLNAPRLSALSVIVFSGPITLGSMAAAEQVRPPTMTRIVNALVAQGLVSKTSGTSDRRTIRLTATMRGKRTLVTGRRQRTQALAGAIRQLSAAESDALLRALPVFSKLAGSL